jgi:hypothetical protein
MATGTTTTPAPGNHTKVILIRGQNSVSASGAATGGFVNTANLMHEVVQKMVSNGFNVVYASEDNTDLNTASWGTLASTAGVLSWTAPTAPPKVGAPTTGSTVNISGGSTASITLEAGERVDALNPTAAVAISGVTPAAYYPKEPWRVKFELLSTECVAAYVATPLQLPGYYGSASALVAEAWGLPGSNSRIVDSVGVPLDAAGAIGSQQIIPSYQHVTEVKVDTANAGTGYAVGDFLYEDQYTGKGTAPSTTGNSGLYFVIGSGTSVVPLPTRYRAIFRVESIIPAASTTTAAPGAILKGAIKSLSISVPGKYEGSVTNDGTTTLKTYTGTGTGTVKATLNLDPKCSAVNELDPYQGFYNRGGRVGSNGASYPLTYELAVSNSGFFLGIYESSWATQVGGATTGTGASTVPGRFNWMVCQRPVDRNTGVVLDTVTSTTSKHPVFCINGVGGRYYTFVVREKDIAHPTAGPEDHTKIAYYNSSGVGSGTLVSQYVNSATQPYGNYIYRVPATLNSEDNHLLFNPENQISLTEDKKYLVSFPHNLSTPRFRYTEELDLVGLTSSDVLMSGQVITINTYGESVDREYLALPPSGKYNTGLRICVAKTTTFGTP